MRLSISDFMNVLRDVQDFLNVGSFKMRMYDDYCCADFNAVSIEDVRALMAVCKGLIVRLYPIDSYIQVRIYDELYK